MNVLCRIFGHHRSRVHASFDHEKNAWTSWCDRCGAGVIRDEDGKWHERPVERTSVS